MITGRVSCGNLLNMASINLFCHHRKRKKEAAVKEMKHPLLKQGTKSSFKIQGPPYRTHQRSGEVNNGPSCHTQVGKYLEDSEVNGN